MNIKIAVEGGASVRGRGGEERGEAKLPQESEVSSTTKKKKKPKALRGLSKSQGPGQKPHGERKKIKVIRGPGTLIPSSRQKAGVRARPGQA